jgi:hypothetical protein
MKASHPYDFMFLLQINIFRSFFHIFGMLSLPKALVMR